MTAKKAERCPEAAVGLAAKALVALRDRTVCMVAGGVLVVLEMRVCVCCWRCCRECAGCCVLQRRESQGGACRSWSAGFVQLEREQQLQKRKPRTVDSHTFNQQHQTRSPTVPSHSNVCNMHNWHPARRGSVCVVLGRVCAGGDLCCQRVWGVGVRRDREEEADHIMCRPGWHGGWPA